jgi:hypothetical protein
MCSGPLSADRFVGASDQRREHLRDIQLFHPLIRGTGQHFGAGCLGDAARHQHSAEGALPDHVETELITRGH